MAIGVNLSEQRVSLIRSINIHTFLRLMMLRYAVSLGSIFFKAFFRAHLLAPPNPAVQVEEHVKRRAVTSISKDEADIVCRTVISSLIHLH